MIFYGSSDYEAIHTSDINRLYEWLQENVDYPFRAGVIAEWCLNAKPKDRYHNFHVRIEVEEGQLNY